MHLPPSSLPHLTGARDAFAAFVAQRRWPVMYWKSPSGERMAAAQTAMRIVSDAPCRHWCEELRAHIRTLHTGDFAPLREGGAPAFISVHFDPLRHDADMWSGFPAVSAWVPELLCIEGGTRDGLHAAGAHWTLERLADVVRTLEAAVPPERHVHPPPPLPSVSSDAEAYRTAVAQALSAIADARVEKLVPGRILAIELGHPADPAAVVSMLEQLHPSSYVIACAVDERRLFISATPERLARVHAGRVLTEAVAGTVFPGLGADAGFDLLADEKTAREHAYVVDMITGALHPICDTVSVGVRGVRQLRGVGHVVTPVEGVLHRDAGLVEVLTALHPTPAVAGTPRDAAMRELRTIEPFARGMFAGVCGWIDAQGNGEAAVTIRSALLHGTHAWLFAGAGVVAGSDPFAEERETAAKLDTMREVLA